MHVITRPTEEPVALLEQWRTLNGQRRRHRVLVFQEGLLPRHVVTLLGKLLAHI